MVNICELINTIQLFILNEIFIDCTFDVIYIPQGKLRGIRNFADDYKSYLGIPYASVNKRFQEPGPPPQWSKTFNAVHKSIKCKQINRASQATVGEEDCLVLDVFVPSNSNKELLPVLVFVHGGGFHFGSNNGITQNPKYLLQKKIIVVNINYRLGAFGFLCLQTPEAPGNMGLKDQVAALRWIKNNIQSFGGNPQSITVFGQSVGASSLSYLLLSTETEGLFQNIVMDSGSLLVPYALDNDPIGTAVRIANRIGYETNDPEQLLKIYQNTSADDILKASHFDSKNDPFAPYVFRPCISKSEESLVKSGPRELLETTLMKRKVNIVIGYNNKEGIKWAQSFDIAGLEHLNRDFSKIIPHNLLFSDEEEKSAFVAEVKEFYFKNQSIDSFDSLIDYFSDCIIMYPLVTMTRYFLRSNITIYNHYFQYDSNRNLAKFKTTLASKPGASHTDDLFYVFDTIGLRKFPPTPADAEIIDAVTSFWSNFATKGNPSTPKIQWTPSEKDNLRFLSIDKKIEIMPLPNSARIRFWEGIYERYKSY